MSSRTTTNNANYYADAKNDTSSSSSSSSSKSSKQQPQPPHKFVDVSEGPKHSMGITENGTIYSWGHNISSNNLGQLGRDTTSASKKNKKKKIKDMVLKPGRVEFHNNDEDRIANNTNDNHNDNNNGNNNQMKGSKVFVSTTLQSDTGHSAIVNSSGTKLWMSGCDRWQQLSIGRSTSSSSASSTAVATPDGGNGNDEGGGSLSSSSSSGGYTWEGGKLWQTQFTVSKSIFSVMNNNSDNSGSNNNNNNNDNNANHDNMSAGRTIRDVSLGADHTLILSANKRDVYAFGKCGDNQCGFIGKPYVSAPRRSKLLSASASASSKQEIAAICAIESCSMTIDDHGEIIHKVGKCYSPSSSSSSSLSSSKLSIVASPTAFSTAIEKCIHDAQRRGLITTRLAS